MSCLPLFPFILPSPSSQLSLLEALSLAKSFRGPKSGQEEVLCGWVRSEPHFTSPELAPLFVFFCFFGFPLFSTNQAKKMIFCWGPFFPA